ncbi:MAG: hypothetical protein VX278_11625 [Myxococcota bacterium]|nr:hypothetical protein [Myxococcota bacterium]
MARRIRKKILSLLRSKSEVQEAAASARALAAMLGSGQRQDFADAVHVTRGLLTHKVIARRGDMPWPASIAKELDVEHPAYLPQIGAHLPVSARDAVVLGLVDLVGEARVDAWGWIGVLERPMITTWFRVDGTPYFLGKLPSASTPSLQTQQKRSDDGHSIITTAQHSDFTIEIFHWPTIFEGEIAWAMVSRIHAKKSIQVDLALIIAAMDRNGAHPIFNLSRDKKGNWFADGRPVLSLSSSGNSMVSSTWKRESLWSLFESGEARERVDAVDIHCSAGQASAAEIFRVELSPGHQFSQFMLLPYKRIAPLRRLNETSLWRGAVADRKGLLNAGSYIDIGDEQWLLEQTRYRVLIDKGELSISRCLGVVALTRLGFIQVAGERLGFWLKTRRKDPEFASFLAWAATEFLLWSQEHSWRKAHETELREVLDSLSRGDIQASGHDIFGREGSLRWSEIWRIAALLNGVRALGQSDEDRHRWGLAGARAKEGLLQFLGESPWSCTPDRAPDGSSAALLAAGWLGLVPLEHPDLRKTVDFVSKREHLGGVLLHGGAHVGATAILLAIRQRENPKFNGAKVLAKMASSTGALPSVLHRERGALGAGDDALSAALFLLMVLDHILIQNHTIQIGCAIVSVRNMPTPFGRIDVHEKQASGRWNRYPIPILFRNKT